MAFKSTFSAAMENGDFVTNISTAVDYKLSDGEKKLFINVEATAASKTLTLDLEDGDTVIVANVGGTNAITIKNVSGDTGTSLAKEKVAYIVASTTADASTVLALN